jgi:hypothetical protein
VKAEAADEAAFVFLYLSSSGRTSHSPSKLGQGRRCRSMKSRATLPHPESLGGALEPGGVLQSAVLERLGDELAHRGHESFGDRLRPKTFGVLDQHEEFHWWNLQSMDRGRWLRGMAVFR